MSSWCPYTEDNETDVVMLTQYLARLQDHSEAVELGGGWCNFALALYKLDLMQLILLTSQQGIRFWLGVFEPQYNLD